ncbi:MAG: hypothetical protein HY236_11385, partial [Acidobacteria bacterium]|nr:hypothetical protein [Acidobacteriota bacterium]
MKKARVILILLAGLTAASAAPFGTNYPLLGEYSDLALDEARSVVYLANFTAGRIDVFSLASKGLLPPIRVGINPSAIALSPDGRNLLILNFGSESLFMVNLDSRAVQTVALPESTVPGTPNLPRAAAFGSDGAAIIITSSRVVKYDPATGQLTVPSGQCPITVLGGLPVPQPTSPAEIVNARLATSQDRNTIFAVGSLNLNLFFAFYFS